MEELDDLFSQPKVYFAKKSTPKVTAHLILPQESKQKISEQESIL